MLTTPVPERMKTACPICDKIIKKNAYAIRCCQCQQWVHRSCCAVYIDLEYERYNNNKYRRKPVDWRCSECCKTNAASSDVISSVRHDAAERDDAVRCSAEKDIIVPSVTVDATVPSEERAVAASSRDAAPYAVSSVQKDVGAPSSGVAPYAKGYVVPSRGVAPYTKGYAVPSGVVADAVGPYTKGSTAPFVEPRKTDTATFTAVPYQSQPAPIRGTLPPNEGKHWGIWFKVSPRLQFYQLHPCKVNLVFSCDRRFCANASCSECMSRSYTEKEWETVKKGPAHLYGLTTAEWASLKNWKTYL